NPSDRRVAAVMIGKARHYEFLDELANLLQNDTHADVRSMGAFALDLLGRADTIPILIEALYDQSFDVRSNAGWALVNMAKRIMPQLIVPEVIQVLDDDENPHAQDMAYMVLSRIPNETARIALNRYREK
ncbi:MAG: HEAT repeat domain-containing protein, partial [Chloroflexota bacterium]